MIRMFSLHDGRGKFLELFVAHSIPFLASFKHWFNYRLLQYLVVLLKSVRFIRRLKFDDIQVAIVLLFRLAYLSLYSVFINFDYLTVICHF